MDDRPQPHIVAIAGPNGAGKSTFARFAVAQLGLSSFVNADVIAQGLAGIHPEAAAIDAGRIMLNRIKDLGARGIDFAFETTLSARSYAPWIAGLQKDGYAFQIIFITLRDPDLAVERVKSRVASGGHAIPEPDVRRRFNRAIRNFFDLYEPLADRWSIYDNSFTEKRPVLIARGERHGPADIMEPEVWSNFRSRGHANS